MSVVAPDQSDVILQLSRLNKHYGGFHAVSDVSLSIRRGEFFMIVGPSGCGKSTLIRMLAGLEKQSTGNIRVNRPADAGRPENAMVFQGDSVFPWMTVWDNAAFGLKMRNRPQAEIKDVVGHYLGKTGLARFADAYPHQLSGGMRQRVSIARAFANDPDILLMDEPFSALDAQNKFLLQEELLRIWEETRKTVIFITHSVDEAVMLGDRIMVMTANPGTTKEIVEVDLPRPRDLMELQKTPEYGALVHRIWSSLRQEVNRARELNGMEA
ncbi:MAG TPA: ABC transporter ATP-binding protein [Rhizobiaceae bacterium]|nr:ABC transporter ATP-binding protein [Rhizobiaceae bacterium]